MKYKGNESHILNSGWQQPEAELFITQVFLLGAWLLLAHWAEAVDSAQYKQKEEETKNERSMREASHDEHTSPS